MAAVLSIVLTSSAVFAGNAEIPAWYANGGNDYWTHIVVTNISPVPITVTVTFWKSDGNLLASKTISTGQSTNSNGEYAVTLDERETKIISIDESQFTTYTYGSALINARPNSTTAQGKTTYDGTVYATATCQIYGIYHLNQFGVPINGGRPF